MIKKFSAIIMTMMLALNLCMMPVFVNAEEPANGEPPANEEPVNEEQPVNEEPNNENPEPEKPEFEITTPFADSLELTLDDEPVSLEAEATPETTLEYESDDITVVTVGEDGSVTAVGAGEAKITITAAETDEYKETIKIIEVTVNKKENPITIDFDENFDENNVLNVAVGDSVLLNVEAATELEFQSEDEAVASADNEGNITAVKEGETVITITAEKTEVYRGSTREIRVYTYEWLPLLKMPDNLPEDLDIEPAWVCRKTDEEGNTGEIELLGKEPAELTDEEIENIKAGKLEIWYGYRYRRIDQNIETDIDGLLGQTENDQLPIKYGDDPLALNSKALGDVDVAHESGDEEIVSVEDRDEDRGVIIANGARVIIVTGCIKGFLKAF